MGVPARAPIVEDQEEPTAPGIRRIPVGFEVAAIETLAGSLKTYGFRVALLAGELHSKRMPESVRGRLGQDLRELGALCAETAATIDPR